MKKDAKNVLSVETQNVNEAVEFGKFILEKGYYQHYRFRDKWVKHSGSSVNNFDLLSTEEVYQEFKYEKS